MDVSLITVDRAAQAFQAARAELTDTITALHRIIEDAKRAAMPKLKRQAAALAERRAELATQIEHGPHLFERPRTLVLHGLKVGYAKGKGGIVYGDPDTVVRLIERYFPEATELLIHTKRCPNKEGLAQLSVADLKKLGCEVIDAGDQVLIRPVDGDIDKLVNAYLKELENAES